MDKETEVKVKIGSIDRMSSMLKDAGFSKEEEYHERNVVIDKDREMKDSDRLLRFRKTENSKKKQLFTYKGPRTGEMKTREEIEFTVDIDSLSKVFERLSYSTAFKYEKKRQVWKRDDLEVVLDDLPYIGLYMEIEGTRNQIKALLNELDIQSDDTITKNYLELFESYKEEHDIEAEFMTWESFELEEI